MFVTFSILVDKSFHQLNVLPEMSER